MSAKPSPISRFAPLVTAAVLLALVVMGGISARRPFGTNEYRARVRAALEKIPYKIGPAVGVDAEPTPAAIKLLSPNKIIERHYVDPSNGSGFALLIVHCGDVRDMVGHFPPVCYKGNGWKLNNQEAVNIQVSDTKSVAVRYFFSREEEFFTRRMQVLDFFVIPEEGTTIYSDMDAVEHAARSSEVGGLGVAQVQIVVGEETSPQWRETIVRETLAAIGPAVQVIAQGIKK